MKNIRKKRRKEKIETYLKYFQLFFFFLIIYSYRYLIQISIEFRFKFIELQKFIEFEVEDIRNIFFKKYIFWK